VARGGAKIIDKDLGWKELFKRAEEIENGRVRVGVLSDAMVEGEDFTLAELAAVHEYGTEDGRIPERSFLRSTFDDKREEMVELGKTLVKDVLAGRRTTEQALGSSAPSSPRPSRRASWAASLRRTNLRPLRVRARTSR
jgi:hypothetical protein